MSDDRRDQPIDMRMPTQNGGIEPTFRQLLMEVAVQVGALRAGAEERQKHTERQNERMIEQFDLLVEKVDLLTVKIAAGAGKDELRDKVISDLVKIVGGEDSGLVKKIDDLEKAHAKARNVTIGVALGAGLGGTGLGATLYASGKKLGLWSIAALIGVVALARAAPPPGADPNSETAAWYRSLKEPGTGAGCCSVSDCRPLKDADWRQTGKGYEVHWRDRWLVVPPDRILEHEPNPTGEPVACIYGDPAEVHCFVRPSET